MKRYNCTLSDKRGAFGLCMEEHKEGDFVPFSEVSGLAEQLADATRQCGVMAVLLREARNPLITAMEESSEDESAAVEELIDSIDSTLSGQVLDPVRNDALAMMMDELHDICVGLDAPGGAQNGAEAWEQVKEARDRVLASMRHGRPDDEWTDAATSPVAADYRELQAQHDILQSKYKGAQDLLHELREGAEIHLHNCKICKNEEGVNNWTGKLARIDSVLAGKIPHPAVTVTETIRTAPERIWLQVGDQTGDGDCPFPEHHDEVTWCADSVVACEVPYVRADLVGNIPAPVGGEMRTVTVSGKGLLELVEFACPDHETDRDQQETEIVLLNREAFTSTDGEKMPRGVYAYLAEYPEEGLYGPIGGVDPQGGEPCATASPSSSPA